MSQALSQKTVNTFIKGLITEASELTFPPDASVDELNCDLRKDGSRRRRKAAVIEDNNALSSYTISDADVVSTGLWQNVGGEAGFDALVVQKGQYIYFYDKASLPYSAQRFGGTIDLSIYERSGSLGVETSKLQFASINGALVVASPEISTVYIVRDNTSGTLNTFLIDFRVRDFEWQGDREDYDEPIATGSASAGRIYDTANVGWTGDKGSAALTAYQALATEYPPLTLPWFSGKDATGNFDAAEWEKIFGGTTLAGNGNFIVNFFDKVRAGLSTESEDSRFSCVESFSGRLFYGGLNSSKNGSKVLFSRIVDTVADIGECLQQNNPVSEEISDLLPDDGGVIEIAGCFGIKRLYSFGSTIFVFADNGVWSINGVDGVFKATEYSISRVSESGILTAKSFVSAEGVPFWWSNVGIHTLTFDQVTGKATENNISTTTIQAFWDNIGAEEKLKVEAVYDKINKRIYWGYPSNGETVTSKLNNFLLLDVQLQAFFPWKITDEETDTHCVVGMAFYTGFGSGQTPLNVITNTSDNVISQADNVISTQLSGFATGDPAIVLLIRDGDSSNLTMGSFSGEGFLDWGTADYSSYAEAGYEFLGDLLLQKTAPYITTYMRVTETGWAGDDTTGYDPTDPSGLLLSAYWDFKSTSSSVPQQVYRFKNMPVVNEANLTQFDYPSSVITTRTKLRGRGRSMKLRFDSETGKDFVLLGYSVLGGRNARY